jgi:hypothetical protein
VFVGAAFAGAGLAHAGHEQSTPQASAVGGPCSLATARRLGGSEVAGPPFCRPFLGPSSRAMVVEFSNGTCLPILGWEMFELKGGSWRSVNLPTHGGFGFPLQAVGNDLRESFPIRRPGDGLCDIIDRGTQSRLWHWNGQAFRPGPWSYKRKKVPPPPPPPPREVVYTSPSDNIQCTMIDDARTASVGCQTFEPSARVSMDGNGRLTDICQRHDCAGNAGENAKYIQIAYGHSVTVGRFRCLSETTGMTCVVTATGKGFEIAKAGIKRVG